MQKKQFEFYNYLDEDILKAFFLFCESTDPGETVILKFTSNMGTRTKYVEQVIAEIYDMQKRGIIVHTHGDLLVSGYVRLFLLGEYRTVGVTATAVIHLPVLTGPHKKIKGITDERLQELRQQTAEFIASKTRLATSDVMRLNEMRLDANELVTHGIAHKIVGTFETLSSR